MNIIRMTINNAKVAHFSKIVITGGMSQLQKIKRTLKRYFKRQEMLIDFPENPIHSVSNGAALQIAYNDPWEKPRESFMSYDKRDTSY